MAQTKVKLVSNGVITVDNLHTNHGITTDHIGEGSVLYYTDARVQNYLTTNNYITTTDVASLETTTSLSLSASTLSYVDESGTTTNIDLSSLGYLTSFTETDPIYVASSWYTTTNNSSNWDTAHGWGDHSLVGYLTTETDPVFSASAAAGITSTNITNWNTAYGWGDHSTQSYATETYVNTAVANLVDAAPTTLDTLNELAAALGDDPNFATTISTSIGTKWTQDNTKISNWDTAYGWGNHASAGYLTSFTESDPTVPAHVKSITSTNISNWNTAYGWGNHASAGYLTSLPSHSHSWSSITADTRTNYDLKFQPNAGNYAGFQFLGQDGNNAGYLLIRSNTDNFTPYTANGITLVSDQGGLNFFARTGTQLVRMGTGTSETFRLEGDYSLSLNSSRSPIFYDSNNTGYYVDPASTSQTNDFRAAAYRGNANVGGTGTATWHPDGIYVGSTQWLYGTQYRNNSTTSGQGNLYFDGNYGYGMIGLYSSTRYQGVFAMGDAYKLPVDGTSPSNLYGITWSHPNAGGVAGNLNTHGALILENGTFLAALSGSIRSRDDMRSPIFYDSNNTGYYLDPAGTSNLNIVKAQSIRNDGDVSSDDSFGVYWESGGSTAYAIYREGGSWSHPYPDLRIAFHTGIKLGANAGYNGIRFYNDYNMNTIVASINDGDSNLRGYYDIIAYASDKRLKEKIEPITNAIDKVKKLNGFTYNWNNVGEQYGWEPPKERESGVFAQEVQEVLPEAVRTAPFDQDHDVDGNMYSKSGENFLTVKYEKLVPLLIEAIKEQQQQIEELKQLINK